mgnify:CR=1 FL=1
MTAYEAGLKAQALDGKLSFNLAGFYMDYTDVQIPGSVACFAGGINTFCGIVSNAGKARMQGVEFEARANLGALTLSGSLGTLVAAQFAAWPATQPPLARMWC